MKRKSLIIVTLLLLTACTPRQSSPVPSPTAPSLTPAVTASASASAQPLGPGSNKTELPLRVADGFTLTTYTKGLGNPRVIAVDSNNTALVSIPQQGKIAAIKEGGDSQKTLVEGLNSPHGLALNCDGACKLYVGETDGLTVFDYSPSGVSATNRQRILDLPTGERHTTKTLQLIKTDSGKKLLISLGSSCDVCVEKDNRRATIMIADLDGKNAKVYASGLRNAVFMTENPSTHQIWATEMGRDYLGDELPPDEINIIQEGKNYGWPLCYGKNVHDTDFDKKIDVDNPCKEPSYTASQIDLPAHSSPLGLTFTSAAWPEQFKNSLLVAYHGSWNRSQPTGYKVIRFTLDAQGNYQSKEDFISGWLDKDNQSIGRPVGLTFDNKGNLLISDDKLGNIYKLSLTQ